MFVKSEVSNNDGDASENGKRKAIGLDWQNNNPARAFLHISLLSLHDYAVKMPNFAFVENVNIDSFFQKKKLRTFDNLNTMKYARLCLKKRDFTF